MSDLLNVDKAIERILAEVHIAAAETVTLSSALGRVIAEDLLADVNLPPFANSAMDGYAVRSQDTTDASEKQPVHLRVSMDIPAGQAPANVLQSGEAARIMTGAPLPEGADAVIPVEATDSDWHRSDQSDLPQNVALLRSVSYGDNVRPVGENIAKGERVFKAGTHIGPAHIGMLAALGKSSVPVIRKPRAVVLTSGDELVGIDDPLTPGKIRDANTHTLTALVRQHGGEAIPLPIAADTHQALRDLYETALSHQPDVIISSAGVSVGAADLTRTIMAEYGNIGFWRINLKPGKPLAFGKLRGVPFFGLPGNPVSAMITFDVLVRPALLKIAGREDDSIYERAIVGEVMRSDGRRTYMRVRLQREKGRLLAYATGTQSSGALMSLVLADGLLIIPEDTKKVEPGTELTVKLLRHVPRVQA